MQVSRTTTFAMGAVTALVLGSGTAYAATGGSFILGKSNSAGATSTLTNPNGTALTLNSKAGTPPLRVNRSTKVPNLNSDRLDGLDQSRFARANGTTGAFDLPSQAIDTDGNDIADVFLVSLGCPPGTKRTGGGGTDFTATGATFQNAPDTGNAWIYAVYTDNATEEDPADVIGSIVCYNPRGGVAGSYRTASISTEVSPETMAKILEVAKAKQGR